MKKPILPILLACGTLSLSAQSSGFGIGIMVGEPTGLSAKAWTGEGQAFAFGLAYGGWGYGGWGHGGHFHAHADYLLHNFSLTNVSKGRMALHYGPGVRVRSWTGDRYWNRGRWYDSRGGHARVGIRFPVGLTYMFEGAPIDIFLEAAPTLDLVPGTSFDVNGGLGFRYYFGG